MYDKVRWPDEFHPRISPIYALNDIDVDAPPEVVWQLLIDAENWVDYFPPEDQIAVVGSSRELRLGSEFTRVTVGFGMKCEVTEFEPFRRLSWSTSVDGDETGSTAYHGWVITPTDTGSHVLTEETQQGEFFLEELGRKHPGAVYAYHQDWVERLARAAEYKVGKKIR